MKRLLLALAAAVSVAACGFGPQQYIPVDAPKIKPWQAPDNLAPLPTPASQPTK